MVIPESGVSWVVFIGGSGHPFSRRWGSDWQMTFQLIFHPASAVMGAVQNSNYL
jgi:hypothetical protein